MDREHREAMIEFWVIPVLNNQEEEKMQKMCLKGNIKIKPRNG